MNKDMHQQKTRMDVLKRIVTGEGGLSDSILENNKVKLYPQENSFLKNTYPNIFYNFHIYLILPVFTFVYGKE